MCQPLPIAVTQQIFNITIERWTDLVKSPVFQVSTIIGHLPPANTCLVRPGRLWHVKHNILRHTVISIEVQGSQRVPRDAGVCAVLYVHGGRDVTVGTEVGTAESDEELNDAANERHQAYQCKQTLRTNSQTV